MKKSIIFWEIMLCLLALFPIASKAQVTFSEKVPSVDELEKMLIKPSTPPTLRAPRAGGGSRAIEWNAAATTSMPTSAPEMVAESNIATVSNPVKTASSSPTVAMPIGFEFNSSRILLSSFPYVESIAQLMVRNPSVHITIEGHTDAAGQSQKNLLLSWERSLAIYRLLVERWGIDGQRLQLVGKGSFEPLEGVSPTSPLNRRVQFRVVG